MNLNLIKPNQISLTGFTTRRERQKSFPPPGSDGSNLNSQPHQLSALSLSFGVRPRSPCPHLCGKNPSWGQVWCFSSSFLEFFLQDWCFSYSFFLCFLSPPTTHQTGFSPSPPKSRMELTKQERNSPKKLRNKWKKKHHLPPPLPSLLPVLPGDNSQRQNKAAAPILGKK